jgi:hypothetical protein
MLDTIINAIGSNKMVVANGIWNGAVWNSSMGDSYRYILSKVFFHIAKAHLTAEHARAKQNTNI